MAAPPSEAELTLADIRSEIKRVERVLAEKGPASLIGVGSTGLAPGPYLERLRRYEVEYEARVAVLKTDEEA